VVRAEVSDLQFSSAVTSERDRIFLEPDSQSAQQPTASSAILSQSEFQTAPLSLEQLETNWFAQVPPSAAPPPPQTPELPKLPETIPSPSPPPTLTVPETQPQEPLPAVGIRVKVKNIEVRGSTVFTQAELDKVVAPFLNRELTFEQLLGIRTAITELYTSRGYSTSGAFLPPQDITSGTIIVQVVEGELEQIDIQGLTFLRKGYVRDRIKLAARPPLNIRKLEEGLQLLQTNPLFTQVQAELKAGTSPGRSVLTLNLKEAKFITGFYTVENRDSPSTGSWRHTLSLVDQNLTTFGDRLSIDLAFSSGVQNYTFDYQLPVNARNGTFLAHYERGDQAVVEAPFDSFGINSETETFSVGFRQPIIRRPSIEFALSLSTDIRRSQTFIFNNIPFSFSAGPENGLSKVTVLRFAQDWTQRRRRSVLSARSQFSVGIDAFDATVNDSGTDGRFVAWLGQFQWVQAWGPRVISVFRVASQLTEDSLLPLEQFSVGGVDTVRGYRQNQRVGDNGIVGSFELRFPIVDDRELGSLQLASFIDVGRAWNSNGTTFPDPKTLFSAGVGIRWQLNPYLSTRFDWAIPINPINQPGDSLQDSGLFFSLRFQPY
jgi:hemolysin activation/secretion protein